MNTGRPERSKAAIRNVHGVRVLGPGQRVDDWVLVAVAPTHATLRAPSGHTCYIPVFLPPRERKALAQPTPQASVPPPSQRLPSEDELRRGIRAAGVDRYVITRKLFEKLVAKPHLLIETTRIRSLVRDGRSVGMLISKLLGRSPLALIGLRQGDVLVKLNGQPLTTAGRALAAITALQTTREATLSLLREGKPVNLTLVLD